MYRASVENCCCTGLISPLFGTLCEQAPFYLVVETSGSNAEHDGAKLDTFLEDAMGCVQGKSARQLSDTCLL